MNPDPTLVQSNLGVGSLHFADQGYDISSFSSQTNVPPSFSPRHLRNLHATSHGQDNGMVRVWKPKTLGLYRVAGQCCSLKTRQPYEALCKLTSASSNRPLPRSAEPVARGYFA